MRVGFRQGRIADASRPNWDGDGPRPIDWFAWYPAAEGATEASLPVTPWPQEWFKAGPVALDAPLAANGLCPLVVYSHGTGCNGLQVEWLARELAARGFIVVGINHHGNNNAAPFRAEGFLCSWERPRDVSMLIDHLLPHPAFAGRIDADRIYAVGYSLGGVTVALLLGAIMIRSPFAPGANLGRGPREFPDLVDHLPRLMETSQVFRDSWARMSDSYHDPRIKAALLLAPGRSVQGFSDESVAAIDVPTHIMVGGADALLPSARWLQERLKRSAFDIVADDAGHYVFLPESTELGRNADPASCVDPASVNRGAVHRTVIEAALKLFMA
ncbi:alpha/beta fold hydrolase [Bradyrhizobium sp. SRS-191]|uniref:alpha/beta hydrolase family protein n=1 Tax=Bradyrhizobium sp. SRS-191 TaxID=2962606 RepID=UPI00211DB13A|nr:alpha/beta fold hydrolase [Bradyrhizobium sp. SRS-191]